MLFGNDIWCTVWRESNLKHCNHNHLPGKQFDRGMFSLRCFPYLTFNAKGSILVFYWVFVKVLWILNWLRKSNMELWWRHACFRSDLSRMVLLFNRYSHISARPCFICVVLHYYRPLHMQFPPSPNKKVIRITDEKFNCNFIINNLLISMLRLYHGLRWLMRSHVWFR